MWRPRSSALGGYIACDLRAELDRSATLRGEPIKSPDSPAGCFGHVSHSLWQIAAKASGAKPPKPEQIALAAQCKEFDGSESAMMVAALAVAKKALKYTPEATDWVAEREFDDAHYPATGHIDLDSESLDMIVDLKSTTMIPTREPKIPHVYQMAMYCWLAGRRYALLIYVSRDGTQVRCYKLDFHDPTLAALQLRLVAEVKRISDPDHRGIARLGKHCSDLWCPHKCTDLPSACVTEETKASSLPANTSALRMFT